MAGVSCKAGTEAIVGLSNPSYNREGFRILFPGAAASGPRPSNPAFPSPGSLLWGVTFCSILTTGNRRCPQPRKVRVASVPLTSRSSITREVGGGRGPLPSALQATTHPAGLARKQSPLLFFGELPAAWRAPQEADSEKMAAASAEAGERKGTGSSNPRTAPDPRHRRQYRLPLVCKDPLFLPGPSGADEVPFRSRMEADEHEKWFREPPPPSLKSS